MKRFLVQLLMFLILAGMWDYFGFPSHHSYFPASWPDGFRILLLGLSADQLANLFITKDSPNV